jgi:hypothetical protein
MFDLALLLLQNEGNYSATGVFRFFAGFAIILFFYIGALTFTYWISKDE